MSGSGVPDEGFDRLLRGGSPDTPEEHELGAFVEDVQAAFPTGPLLTEEAHLAGIADAARGLADGVAGTQDPAVGRQAPGSPRRRRAAVKVPVFRSLTAKIVAALVLVMSMFGGLAVAGALPGGVQHAVSNAANGIGVNLPGGDDEDAVAPTQPVELESEAPEPPATDESSATDDQGDQNEQGDQNDQGDSQSADDQGDQNEQGDQNDQGDSQSADDQGDQNEQGDSQSGTGSSDQGDQNDQGDQGDQGGDNGGD